MAYQAPTNLAIESVWIRPLLPLLPDRRLARESFPALDDHVDVGRLQLHPVANPAASVTGNQGGARAEIGSSTRHEATAVLYGIPEQRHWLGGGVQGAADHNNLGGVLEEGGDLEGAKMYFETALDIDETAYGPSHPSIATLVNNLGRVLRKQGNLEEARSHFERVLDLETYGAAHANLGIWANNLGEVFRI